MSSIPNAPKPPSFISAGPHLFCSGSFTSGGGSFVLPWCSSGPSAIYFFVILYAILFYFLSTLLFLSDLNDYSGYEDYSSPGAGSSSAFSLLPSLLTSSTPASKVQPIYTPSALSIPFELLPTSSSVSSR
ncbi:hypothetical protein [Tunturiibacter gelidiferens]|uniref:hypothetical protein n=1 Tax=Tunturiibacter gelidiferens TaxID=3069689 RepID=UPI003D9AFBAA